MAEENQTPVNLGDLGSASASDIRQALQGQPSPVEEGAASDSETPTEPGSTSKTAEDVLGTMSNNLLANDNGTFTFVNPYDTNLDVDLDQFETQRRRVSEDSMLSGILNGVEGLEEGFTYSGLEDTARRSEEAQGVVNKMKNGMTQLVADTTINVGQGFASLLYGVPSAIVHGDITKLYDNSVANAMDRGTEFLDEFYKIKRGGNQSGMQKAANFIFDDLAGGASFVMGAIATEMAFTALSVATLGGAAPAQAAATVGLVARGTRLVQKALQGGKALMAGTLVDDALRASRALGSKVTRQAATSALTDAAAAIRTPMAMQAAARVSRQLITGASMESGMEARHMLNAAVENHKQQYEELNGRGSFTDEMADAFREEISGHADGVFGANMALVGASNMLMFPKLFGVGLRRGMKATKMIDTSKLSQRARARLAKNLGVTEGNLPKMIDAARGNTMGRIAGRFGEVGRVTAANTRNALYEGFIEEGGQGVISRSAEDYIAKRYDPRGVDSTVKYVDSFLEGLKGSYTTADGFKEIGIGMLLAFTGVPMYAKGQKTDSNGKPIEGSEWKWRMMGGYADARQSLLAQDRKAQALVNLSEKHGDVGGILRQEVQNMHRQNTLQNEEQVAISEGRFKDAKDIESERIFSHAASKVATGRYEQSIREAEQIMEEISDEELREQLGPEAKNMTSDDLRAHKTKTLASYKARMERAREAYEKAGEIYRGEDPDIHTGVAYMVYMAKDKDAREKAIAEEMAEAIEDMNQDQILDLVRAQSELDLTDEQLGEILTRINRNKDIDKQLKTKLERKIIKNVDPVKAEQRAAEIEALQKEQQDNLDFMQELMDTMAVANNVARNKYDFSPEFLQDLAQLHFHISRQNQDVTFQEKDIEQLHTDLMAVSADRMRLIAEYNDFIKPGGVQRFEERMIGSIERLADMSLEEQMEARQEAASEQDMEEQMAQDEETPPTAPPPAGAMPGQQTQGAQGTSNMPPTDDGSGGFAVPDQAPGMDTAPDKEFGFPDVRPEVPTTVTPPGTVGPETPSVPTGVPGSMVVGEPREVTASENEPTTPVVPVTPPAESQQPVGTVVGSVSFEFSGPRKGLVDVNHGTSQHFSVVHPEFEGTINRLYPKDAMPAGTPMQLTEESNGTFMYRFANGDPMYRTDTVPANVMKQLRLNGGRLDLKVTAVSRNIKTKYGTRPSTGGISVVRKRRGEEIKVQNPHIERRVSEVLPNGLRNITGYGIAGTNGKLLPITGQPTLTVEPVSDDRFSGNVYISTVDSNGTKAWHGVKLAPMGKARAKQILDVLDAFNKFQTNQDTLTPQEMKVLRDFFTAYSINPNQDKKELRKQVAMNLRRVSRFAWNSEQKEKATETVNGQPRYTGPLLAIEPIGKSDTLTIVSHKHGRIENANKTGAWYSHRGNTGIPTQKYEGILAELSNMELNVAQEGETIVPDGNGNFETKTAPELIMEHGMFNNRMPIVSGTELYNEEVTELEYEIAGRTAVPTREAQDELRQTPVNAPAVPSDLSIDLDTLDFDPSKVSFLMDEVSDDLMDTSATDPMERAGRTYTIPGLTSRQLRDGINFGAGIMARAFITHTRTVDRAASVSPDYLRRHVKVQLEQQLFALKQRPQEGITKQQVEAHELYLQPEIFDRLMDMAMLEMLRQSKGIIRLRKGNISDVLASLREEGLTGEELQESERAEASENPMAAFDSNFAFGVDPKSTLRLEAKMLLMGLTDTTATNAQTIGLAGRRFLNLRDLQEKMSEKLAGVDPDWNSVKARLEIHKATYPQFQAVLDAMSDTAALQSLPASVRESKNAQRDALAIQDMIRNQMVVFAAKEVTTMESLVVKRQKNYDDPRIPSEPAEVKIWNSNSRNMREHAANDLRSSLVQNGFFDLDGKPNKEKFKTLHKKLVGLSELPDATRSEALATILSEELGIQVPPNALTSANTMVDEKGRRVFANLEKIIDKPNNNVGVFGRFRAATKTIGQGMFDLEDVVGATRGVGKDLTDMFVYLADYRENFIQNSSKDGDGRTRYHYSASKLVHSQLRDAKERQKDGGVNAPMLGKRFQLLNDDNQSLIGLTYLSGMKAEGVGNERDFHGMERGDLALAQLALFNNRNTFVQVDAKGQGRAVSKFMLPTLADKHTTPILQAPTHTAEELGIVVDPTKINKPWNKIRFRDVMPDIKRVFELSEFAYNIDREAQRVLDIHAGKMEGMTEAQRTAVGFVMAPGLNPIARQLMDGKIQRKDFKAAVRKQAMIEFEGAMDADLQYMLEQTRDVAWVESTTKGREGYIGSLNHFQATKKVYNGVAQHVGRPGQKFDAGNMHVAAFVAFVAKYNYEALGVRSGIVRDVMGDPGAFVKLNSEGNIHVTKTAVNMGKRFAAIIAPGNVIPKVTYTDRNGNKVSNESVNYLVMPARVVTEAAHIKYLREKLGQSEAELAMQQGYDSADAAEYTTVEEHLGILYAQGKITQREMAGVLKKVRKAEELLDKLDAAKTEKDKAAIRKQLESSEVKLDVTDMAWFQPMKPVTTARDGDHALYVKSASFPLVPGLTHGTELDKLRKFMEKNSIQRAAYDSAVKLGNYWSKVGAKNVLPENQMVPVHVGDKVEINETELNKRVIRGIDRKFMRIQQEVPVSKKLEKVHGSQAAKLFLVNLLDSKFILNGKEVDGRTMHARYLEARQEELDARLEAFANKYKLSYVDGVIGHTPESIEMMRERLLEEAIDRNYDENEIAHLMGTRTEASPSQERLENLLKAVVFKEVYEPVITGFSGPIRPEVGIKPLSDSSIDMNDIMWVMKKGKRVFKGNKLKVAQGKQLDQIIMPWKYKAKLEKYMDENGNINADELPPELLKVFAYRIPGQKKSSSAAFEIVGFLPKQYGDTLIVNEELVGRIGQDYDIDKMFGFLYAVDQAEDGTISVVREDNAEKPSARRRVDIARNKQIDIYLAAMESQDIEVQKAKHSPVTDGYAAETAEQLELLRTPDVVRGLPMSTAYNADKADAARSGKSSIGVFATQNVLHAQWQGILMPRGMEGLPWVYNPAGQIDNLIVIKDAKSDNIKDVVKRYSEKGRVGAADIVDETFVLNYKTPPVAGKKSDQFSRLLNHSVDNENNQLLAKLGVTPDTWDIWTSMTHVGYNQETIGLLVAMPGVQKYLAAKEHTRRLGVSGTVEPGDIIAELLPKGVELSDLSGESSILDKESMLAMIQGSSELTEQEQTMMNIAALQAVEKSINIAKDTKRMGEYFRIDTNRPKSLIELDIRMAKAKMSDMEGFAVEVTPVIYNHTASVAGQITNHIRNTYGVLTNLEGDRLNTRMLYQGVEAAGLFGDSVEHVTNVYKGLKAMAYTELLEGIAGRTAQEIREEAHDLKTGGIATRLIEMRTNKPEVANNAFIKQLVAVKGPGQYPHVEFPGDRQLEASDVETQRAFLDLLQSSDPEVKQFAEELVYYAMATTAGRLKSRSFMKFVPAEWLQSKGVNDKVTFKRMNLLMERQSVFNQIVRHNPELAPVVYDRAVWNKATTNRGRGKVLLDSRSGLRMHRGAIRFGDTLYISEYPGGMDTLQVDPQTGEKYHLYPLIKATTLGDGYLSDEYSSKQLPYNYSGIPKMAKGQAGSLDMPPNMDVGVPMHTDHDAPMNSRDYAPPMGMEGGSGNFGMPQYDPSRGALGMPAPPVEVPTDVMPPANVVPTRNPITQVNDKVLRNKEAQEKRPNELRDFLQKNGLLSNPFLQLLATAQDHLAPEDRVKIVIDPESSLTRGRYVGATNTVHFRTGQEANVRTVTHELMHAMTLQAIGIAAGNIKIDDKQIEAQMKAAVADLQSLFQKARSAESLERMGLTWAGFQQAQRGFRAFQKKKQGVALTVQEETDIEFLRENLDQYYGLVNVKEFISEAFSNKEFAQRLAQVPLNRNETFIDRLMAAVGRVFKSLGIMNSRDNAFLKEVYVVSMNIADIQTGGAISKQFGARQSQAVSQGMNPDMDLLDDGMLVSDLIDGKDLGPIADEDIKDIINYKKKRVRQFEELQSRYKDNREFVRRVEGLLVKERQELHMLENGLDDSEGLTAAHILDMGRRELDYARKTIENVDATDAQISMALSALENIYSVVEFYDESRAILADPALKDVATELRRTAAELKDDYLDKARAVLRADAIRELGTSGMETVDKAFETVREVGPLEGRFMDASRLGIPELAFLDKIVRDAAQNQRMQFNARATAYMDKSKAFQKTSYFQKHGWNGMVELDAKGNPTPRLITMMSGRFEAEAKRKWQELGNTKEYYDWRNSVTERIDVDALFDISGDVVKAKKNSKYIQHLEGKFGPAATAEFLERQEIMLQDYIDNRNGVFDNLDMTLSPEEAQKAKDLWVLKNNPVNAYKRSTGKMKYVKGNTSRFLIDIPLRTVNGKDTGYYDARFMEMMQEKDAIEYYRFYRQQMREMMAMLPSHKMNRDEHLARAGLFIPAISKQMTADLFTKDGLIDTIGNLPESVKASLTIDPEFNINKLIDPVTGRPRQELPMYFMGQVDPETQDYNMDNTFLAFTMMATTYDSKNKIEDKVRMTRSVLSNARMISESNLRDRVMKLVGAEVTKGYRDDMSRDGMMRVVDTVVDNFYGYQQKTDMTGNAPRWMWNKDARAKIENLEEQLENTTDAAQKARIEKEIADATPQVSANKFIHKIQQFIQAKGMAWNIPAAIVNMSFGTISVFRHAAGRADFNETHARQAFMVMTSSSLNNMTLNTGLTQNAQARKIQNMMVNFDVLKDFTEMRYDVRKFVKQSKESGVTAAAQQGFNKLRMYEIQRSSEYFTYGHATVAYLKSEMVNGVSLWDAMGENGVIDIDGYRPGEEQHLRIMNRIDQINKRIHGNYDPNSPIAIKRTMLGRLMMQFRSWFPEAVAQRYEGEKYDPYLERTVKGTYQTMFFSGEIQRNLKAMLPMLLPSYLRTANMDKMSDDISQVDQENIRKFAASLRQYLQVAILLAVLRAMKDDEDDKEATRMLNRGLNLASRLENDLALFGSPGAMIDMTQGDFLAAIGFLADIEKFFDATIHAIQGEPTIETGVYAGKNRMWHHFQKLVPHLGAIQRMVRNAEQDMSQ